MHELPAHATAADDRDQFGRPKAGSRSDSCWR